MIDKGRKLIVAGGGVKFFVLDRGDVVNGVPMLSVMTGGRDAQGLSRGASEVVAVPKQWAFKIGEALLRHTLQNGNQHGEPVRVLHATDRGNVEGPTAPGEGDEVGLHGAWPAG